MKWETCTLNDICNKANGHIQTGPFGSQLHQSDYSDTGTPVVMPKDIINGIISEDEIARVEEQHVLRLSRHKVAAGDILFSRRGDVGRCAYISEKEAGWLCGTGCLRVTVDAKIADSRFVFYCLQQPSSVEWIEKHAIGATMLNLNTGILASVPLLLPDLPTQRRIASILSAYDDLIENNRRQIQLLEEAAQRLYREWFVELRFPGHEDVKIVDGVPEGWSVGTLADIAEFKRGQAITKDETRVGNVPVVAGGLEPAYYHDTSNTGVPVVTVSGSGANAGFTRMYHTRVWASDCSYIDTTTSNCVAWVYCFLKSKAVSIERMKKGAAQPHVYAKDLNAMKVLLPDDSLLKHFASIVESMFNYISKLDLQTKLLVEARDRLLPKLMSGEMEVDL